MEAKVWLNSCQAAIWLLMVCTMWNLTGEWTGEYKTWRSAGETWRVKVIPVYVW